MGNKKESFSSSLLFSVRLVLSAAFIVMFISNGLLILFTEEDVGKIVFKILIILFCCVVLFFLSMYVVAQKIGNLVRPLDRLVGCSEDDSLYCGIDPGNFEKLAEKAQKANDMYKQVYEELDETKKNLEEAQKENQKITKDASDSIEKAAWMSSNIKNKTNRLNQYSSKEQEYLDDIIRESTLTKKMKNEIYVDSVSLKKSIYEARRMNSDNSDIYDELKKSYGQLVNMLNESADFIDDIFSELSSFQSGASQLNILSVNTSLDFSRAGASNMTTVMALDEIKKMSVKLNEKADEISMMIIKLKNTTKLAVNQADYSFDQTETSFNIFVDSDSRISKITDKTDYFIDKIDELLDNVAIIISSTYELNNIYDTKIRELDNIRKTNDELSFALKNIGEDVNGNFEDN